MGRMARSCTQSLVKAVNTPWECLVFAMILYALWMLRVWLRDHESDHAQTPWFTYTVLGLGVLMCLIACSGHVAAETAIGCCLCIDFPEDSTENLDKLKEFIKDNFDVCKWIGFTVVALQGLSILLAIILKALGIRTTSCDVLLKG